MLASMNPRPCGYIGDPKHACKRLPMQAEKYKGRVSGLLLDRIDLHIEVLAAPFQELSAKQDGAHNETMREQVKQVREVQANRFGTGGVAVNARMGSPQMRKYCALDPGRKTKLASWGHHTLSENSSLMVREMARFRVREGPAPVPSSERNCQGSSPDSQSTRSTDRREP